MIEALEFVQPGKTCCFTGHRPKFFPWGENINDSAAKKLLDALEAEIRKAVADGYKTFLYGGALGVDSWAAQIVLRLKEKLPLTLIAVLPFPDYNKTVKNNTYRFTLAASDRIIYVDNKKKMAALAARDQYMVDCSSRLIAVYDERSHLHSGTYRALCYAKEKGLEIRQICWMNFV